jgi:hypothetical protein
MEEPQTPASGPLDIRKLLVPQELFSDPAVWSLIGSNLLTIVLAIVQRWDARTVLWLYWWQSVIIGFFNVVKILSLRDFSTEGFKLSNTPARPTVSTKVFTAFFFLFHYGFFHLIYAIFLSSRIFGPSAPTRAAPFYFDINLAVFFANGLFTFFVRKEWRRKNENIGTVMFAPYYRIVPMHLTIILGGFFGHGTVLYFFLLLKTVNDVISYAVSHKINFLLPGGQS